MASGLYCCSTPPHAPAARANDAPALECHPMHYNYVCSHITLCTCIVRMMLGQQAARLKFLAETLHIPVLVTNQITTTFGGSNSREQGNTFNMQSGHSREGPSESHLVAALGTKWAHCVNTRLVLEVCQPPVAGAKRHIKVAKSPAARLVTASYTVTRKGLELDQSPGQHQATEHAVGGVVGMQIRNDMSGMG
eukprot:9503841-Pyramimonas_sp.AAC.2